MRAFVHKPNTQAISSLVAPDTPAHAPSFHENSLLRLQRAVGNQGMLWALQAGAATPDIASFSGKNSLIQRQPTPPRSGVSPAQSPISITLDMPIPAIPAPDHSQDETRLGAWERANFLITPRLSYVCDNIVNNGVQSSYVTEIGIQFSQSTFQFFIARHLYENSRDRSRDVSERIAWRRIYERVRAHAIQHFALYRQVVDSMRQTIMHRFDALPTRNHPIRIPQQDLETYVSGLLIHLNGRLSLELWQATCNWEHTDYPRLLTGIAGGRLTPNCGPRPSVPPEPNLPVVVTPGLRRTRPPAGQTRPSR